MTLRHFIRVMRRYHLTKTKTQTKTKTITETNTFSVAKNSKYIRTKYNI